MRKIIPFFMLAIITLFGSRVYAQVTIGKLAPPDYSAVLQVISPDSTKGVLIPEMTEKQRDAIVNPADGLVIYNIDEDCFNYWSLSDNSWESLCGASKAVFTLPNGCSDVTVNGAYVQATALDGSNYLSLLVDVTKAGAYSITATTTNGYGFTTQGTFLSTGRQTVMVPGQGKPVNTNQTPGDMVTIDLSGADSGCSALTIPVMPPVASYSLNCSSAKFNGTYVKNKPLTAANTVTLNVNVTDISTGGSWSVSTNTVNGVSFSGSGMFTTLGQQTITLQGSGTPTTTDPIGLTFTTNSEDGSASCNAIVPVAIPPLTVLSLGTVSNAGYSVFSQAADTYKMLTDKTNFGTQDNSTVQFGDGTNTWKVINPTDGVPGAAAIVNYLNGTTTGNPPDIVVAGVGWEGTNAEMVNAFVNYLQKGGVVIMFCENTSFNPLLMKAVFGSNSVQSVPQNGNSAGARYQFPLMNNDPIINGPFGNLGGLYWGEDASTTCSITGATPNLTSQVTVYTTVEGTIATAGNITAFRHNSLNWIWVGDGGFNSSYNHTSTTICPFLIQQTAPYIPVAKPNYSGSNTGNGSGPVYNSIFTANAMAWAINQAMTNGINRH